MCAMRHNNLLIPLILVATLSASPPFADSGMPRGIPISPKPPAANPTNLTSSNCASTLPLDTRVRVYNRSNGSSVIVTIVDRGPFIKRRIIDLSSGVAKPLGFVGLEQVDLLIVP